MIWYDEGMKKMRENNIIGIDEVGRGPLAGPVAVGAVCIYAEHYARVKKLFPVVRDSKKLSAKAREEWEVRIREAEVAGFLVTAVAFVAPRIIDKKGIAPSIRMALAQALENVALAPEDRPPYTEGGPRGRGQHFQAPAQAPSVSTEQSLFCRLSSAPRTRLPSPKTQPLPPHESAPPTPRALSPRVF